MKKLDGLWSTITIVGLGVLAHQVRHENVLASALFICCAVWLAFKDN